MKANLRQWAENGGLRIHRTSAREIANLLRIVERDLKDARAAISSDWQFGIAYKAALKLCTILLYAEGYRPGPGLQHYRTIQSLPLTLGAEKRAAAEHLEACRKKRNIVEYDCAGATTEQDAEELTDFVTELRSDVLDWLRRKYPALLGSYTG